MEVAMASGPREYDVEALILEQLTALNTSSIENGKALVQISTNQVHQAEKFHELSESVKRVTEVQANCQARTGYPDLKDTVRDLERRHDREDTVKNSTKTSTSWSDIPLPSPRTMKKLFPWVIALIASAAAALGLIPPGGP